MDLPTEPASRVEQYLGALIGLDGFTPPEYPSCRLELYLDYFVKHGISSTKKGYFFNGAFYSDPEHTTLIEPDENALYIDLASHIIYIYNGTEYVAIGGGGAGFSVEIVDELPETGENGIMYLVLNGGAEPDVYDEYLWVDSTSKFEKVGNTRISFQTKTLTFVKDDSTTETINFMIQP